jgi:hypothetical protein
VANGPIPTRAQRLAALSEVLPSAAFPTGVLALVADYAQPILLFTTGQHFPIRVLDLSTRQRYRDFLHSKLPNAFGSILLPIAEHQLLVRDFAFGLAAWELHGSQFPVAEPCLSMPYALCFLPTRRELVASASGLRFFEVPTLKPTRFHANLNPEHMQPYGSDELFLASDSGFSLFSLTTKAVTHLTLLDSRKPQWSPRPLLSAKGVLAFVDVGGDQLHAASIPPQRGASPLACPPLCNTSCRVRDWFMGVCNWPSAVIMSVDTNSSGVSSPLQLWMPECSAALHAVRVVDAGGAALRLHLSELFRISSDLFVALGAAATKKTLGPGATQIAHDRLYFIELSQSAASVISAAPASPSSSASSVSSSASSSSSSSSSSSCSSSSSLPGSSSFCAPSASPPHSAADTGGGVRTASSGVHLIARVLGSFNAGRNFSLAAVFAG